MRRRRFAAVSATLAILVGGAGTAAAIVASSGDHASRHVVSEVPTSTSTTTTPDQTTPSSSTTPITPPRTIPTVTTPGEPTTTTLPSGPPDLSKIYPGDPPAVGDFSGTISISRGGDIPVDTMNVFDRVSVSATITNDTNRTIWTSSELVPTSVALICTNAESGARSLFGIGNMRLRPGDSDAGGENFTPTHDYIGTVTCELDVIMITPAGIQFDPRAGGEPAHATIVGRVTRVAPVTLHVEPVTFTVTALGQMRPLQLGASYEADVRDAFGTPDATATGTFEVPNRPDYKALGYECSNQSALDLTPLHVQPQTAGPYCRTVFYLNTTTERLAGFRTTSTVFHTEHGTTVGMTESEAQRREGRPAIAGCFGGITIGNLSPDDIQIEITVGATSHRPGHGARGRGVVEPGR